MCRIFSQAKSEDMYNGDEGFYDCVSFIRSKNLNRSEGPFLSSWYPSNPSRARLTDVDL